MQYFNPRSHERSDGAEKKAEELVRISIHAPTRGATTICFGLVLFIDISIHAPTRGATKPSLLLLPRQLFQSTLPREERRSTQQFLPFPLRFQSTLPREERHDRYSHSRYIVAISIHAPTRGATLSQTTLYFLILISIHAPTRGATAILHKKFVYFYTIPTINI